MAKSGFWMFCSVEMCVVWWHDGNNSSRKNFNVFSHSNLTLRGAYLRTAGQPNGKVTKRETPGNLGEIYKCVWMNPFWEERILVLDKRSAYLLPRLMCTILISILSCCQDSGWSHLQYNSKEKSISTCAVSGAETSFYLWLLNICG